MTWNYIYHHDYIYIYVCIHSIYNLFSLILDTINPPKNEYTDSMQNQGLLEAT